MVQRSADQPMCAEFPAQSSKLPAPAVLQQSLRHAERAAKSRYDSAHRGYLHLRCGVSHQIYFAIADPLPHWHPATIDRDARALPFQWLHLLLFQESFEAPFCVAAVFADDAERSALRRFRDQPVKVRRLLGHEPDSRRIRWAIFRRSDDGLNQRHGFYGRPAGSARHAARGARFRLAARRNRAAGSGHRQTAERLPTGYDASLVRARGDAVLLLADPGIGGARCVRRHRRTRPRHKTVLRTIPGKEADGATGMAGRVHPGLSWLGASAEEDRQWRSISGGRRRSAGEGIHGGRNRNGISRRARRGAGFVAERQEPGACCFARGTRHTLADPPIAAPFSAEGLFTTRGPARRIDTTVARRDQSR